MRLRALPTGLARVMVLASLLSCGVFVSFDGYDTSVGARYTVGGMVDGLGGAAVKVVLNGTTSVSRVDDGRFEFPAALADGAGYLVALDAEPPGQACTRAQGTIAGADVTTLAIHCAPSTDATLESLAVSAGPLQPAFVASKAVYAAGPVSVPVIFPAPPTTTTVTATTRYPRAQIRVRGVLTSSGAASVPIELVQGETPIDVLVTAADGVTEKHYTVVVSGSASDYVKASNTRTLGNFGSSVALSGDTLVVGSSGESSAARGVNGPQADAGVVSGAVYVFTRAGASWSQQAYLKASNSRPGGPRFGLSVALSGDSLAVGAPGEKSNATGVNGNEANTSLADAGAVYVFTRTGTVWSQQAYVKASNTRSGARFGGSVALSGDTLAVGAMLETSAATSINGNQADASLDGAGAAYVFTRSAATWSQQAYVKAFNTRADARFGFSVALDKDTLVVGAPGESSAARGVNGNAADSSAPNAGAAYVFARTGALWTPQAYLKASNTLAGTAFGHSVSLSGDLVVVGSPGENSNATGVNGNQADSSAPGAGAAYVFARTGAVWSQEAYLKASNTRAAASFGEALSVSGGALAVGAPSESSAATGAGGNQADQSASWAGAAYLYARSGATWGQRVYLKASNTRAAAAFGNSIALSGAGLAVASREESSSATGVNGDQRDRSADSAGAVYLFR